jgi:hypothetical protein
VLSGCYGVGTVEAVPALMLEIERNRDRKLPTDPIYGRFNLDILERALFEIWAAPVRRFPHFGPIEKL